MTKLTVIHEGVTLTRETLRNDVTHVMVSKAFNGFGDMAIRGLHMSEAKAKADAKKMAKTWNTETFIYPV